MKHLAQDAVVLLVSVALAVAAVKVGAAEHLVQSLHAWRWLGIFVAGSFFTSAFTTAPAIVLLGTFAQANSIWLVVLLGGLGATVGDFIIFSFVRDRVAEDVDYLLSFVPARRRWRALLKSRLFRFFIPGLGALIIASPLPDELGVTLLGLSRLRNRSFLLISFCFNSLGILLIACLARII